MVVAGQVGPPAERDASQHVRRALALAAARHLRAVRAYGEVPSLQQSLQERILIRCVYTSHHQLILRRPAVTGRLPTTASRYSSRMQSAPTSHKRTN